jgi:hypothetical protein
MKFLVVPSIMRAIPLSLDQKITLVEYGNAEFSWVIFSRMVDCS